MQAPVDAGHSVPQLSHAAQLTIRTRVTENTQSFDFICVNINHLLQ